MEHVQGAQVPTAQDPVDGTRPGPSDQLLATEWQGVEQRSGEIVLVVEEAGAPFVLSVIHVLRVSARSSGLGACAVVALGVGHAMRESVPGLEFQATPETL